MTSLWPPRYLVALCTTRSIPCSRGRWFTGVANVLSVQVVIARSLAKAATPARSVRVSVGLTGVSTKMSRVFDLIAASNASRLFCSTIVTSIP